VGGGGARARTSLTLVNVRYFFNFTLQTLNNIILKAGFVYRNDQMNLTANGLMLCFVLFSKFSPESGVVRYLSHKSHMQSIIVSGCRL
jgi:hypothetical protein